MTPSTLTRRKAVTESYKRNIAPKSMDTGLEEPKSTDKCRTIAINKKQSFRGEQVHATTTHNNRRAQAGKKLLRAEIEQ